MFTPISETSWRAALVAACLFCAGCEGGFPGALRGDSPLAPTQATVTRDQIIVTGPPGFCVDPTATRAVNDTGFVVLGNCAAIANSRRALQPDTPAILTATIAAPSDEGRLSDAIDRLDAFFRAPEGLALISRSGDPDAVRILETMTLDKVFLLHASDQSEGAIAGVQAEYWRAYLDIGPRIATLTVLALEDRGLSREESLATLKDFVQSVQQANAAATGQSAQAQPQNGDPGSNASWTQGMFRRIFE